MHRVLEHIDRHLDERLELESLAQVANFSSFHFHRLFAAWMDETLGEYLRRRRIEVGALRLVTQPRLPVLQVALSVGFASAEAFARAFKVRFGPIAPWFGQIGLGFQEKLDAALVAGAPAPLNVAWLVANGYLRRLN